MCKITEEMKGQPIGMFHCPITGRMVIAGTECGYEDECRKKGLIDSTGKVIQ